MRCSLILLLSLAAAAAPRAQSVFGLTGPTGKVIEMTGPTHGSCNYPDDDFAWWSFIPTDVACGSSAPPAPFIPGATTGPLAGDIAVHRAKDRVYLTDGTMVGGYEASTGEILANFGVASIGVDPPLTGLGWDGSRGWLWVSNAFGYGAVEPDGACSPIPRVVFTPKPSGIGLITDIDCDSHTGDLWVCTAGGDVAHFPEGASSPDDVLAVAGPLACGELTENLTGLCLDTSAPPGSFVVTDGFRIARMRKTGPGSFEDAPPLFALPESCWPSSPGDKLLGLGWSARPVTYGEGEGLVLQSHGEATVPSSSFMLDVMGANAGFFAIFYDFGAACPPLALGGAPILLPLAPGWGMVGPFPVSGDLKLPAALPGPSLLPAGLTVHVQAVAQGAGGDMRTSNGLAFTTCRP